MKATLPRNWWLAVPTLLAAVALSWLLNRSAPPPHEAALPKAAIKAVPEAVQKRAAPPLTAVETPSAPDEPAADIFAVRTWEPPPPPVDTTPQAPPLPFKFIGRFVEPGKGTTFTLTDGERILVVRVGDSIGKDYRIEKYARGQLLFRYRPMNIRQTLDIGGPTS